MNKRARRPSYGWRIGIVPPAFLGVLGVLCVLGADPGGSHQLTVHRTRYVASCDSIACSTASGVSQVRHDWCEHLRE